MSRKRFTAKGWAAKMIRPAKGPWHTRFLHSLEDHQEGVANGVLGFFGNRKAVLLLVLIMIPLGVLAIDQSLKSPQTHGLTGGHSPIDPLAPLWYDTACTNGNGWASRFATFVSCSGSGSVTLQGNSTASAFAINQKNPINLDQVSSKIALIELHWSISLSATVATEFQMYLTSNKTLPTQTLAYDARTDNSVALVLDVSPTANNAQETIFFYIRKEPLTTITQQDNGATTGSIFIGSFTVTNNGDGVQADIFLTYTGNSNTAAAGTSFMTIYDTFTGTQLANQTQTKIPTSIFSGTTYYLGLNEKGIVSNSGQHQFVGSQNPPDQGVPPVPTSTQGMTMGIYTPNPTAVSTPSPVDTGGFFGPILKALISIGVWIMQGLAQFLGFIYLVFRDALDTVGNFLGVGAIGTNIAKAIVDFSRWVTSIFSTVFTQIANAITFLINSLTAVTNVLGIWWTQLTNFLGQLANFASFLWTVAGDFLQYTVFAASLMFITWWVWGMMEAYQDIDKFFRWTRWSTQIVLVAFHWAHWLYEQVLEGIILRAKRLIVQWL